MASRIDIAINERGSTEAVRDLNALASAVQAISPKAAQSLRGEALRLGLSTDTLVKKVAVATLRTVVKTTPRLSGQARANWQVKVSRLGPAKTPLLGKLDFQGDATIAVGSARINGTKRKPGQTVWISNALDYIEELNDGKSQQEPAGFVGRALLAGRLAARNAKVLK